MRKQMMISNSRKVSCLKSKTGWSHKVTHEFLKENSWNLEQAINAYDLMIEASLVPLKNSNILQEINNSGKNNKIINSVTSSLDKKKINKKLNHKVQCQIDALMVSNKDSGQLDELSEAVFMLPDISKSVRISDAFKQILINEFIDTTTQELLVKNGHLNWWINLGLQPLYPLVTTGDGNCLLHAASIALNGVSDENLSLRSELYHLITSPQHKDAFYRRWRLQQTINNMETGLVFNEEEWLSEWTSITEMASSDPINTSNHKSSDTKSLNNSSQENISYSSLEEIHVFALAHLLARPVIVVADDFYRNSKGEAIAPIPFSGIYLPLQLPPHSCHKTPIHIAYNAAHFMAVSPLDSFPVSPNSDVALCSAFVPLVNNKFNLLPVHFSRDLSDEVDNEQINEKKLLEEKFSLLEKYFDIDMFNLSGGDEEFKDTDTSLNHHTINNDLHACEEKVVKHYKGLDKLKRFAESTGANLKKTFHKSLFSKHHHRKHDETSAQQPSEPLNNCTSYYLNSLLTRCRMPTARAIFLRQELYAENIEEYINFSKMRLAEKAQLEQLHTSCNNNHSLTFDEFSHSNTNSTPLNFNNATSPKNNNSTEHPRNPLSNKIVNNFKTHKIHDKNLYKLHKLKDVNYFNKSFDEAKNRIRISKEMDEKARRVLFYEGGLIRSSMSDTFKSYQALSSVRLEKFTKVDNRMITATETNACDFNDESPCNRKVPPKAHLT